MSEKRTVKVNGEEFEVEINLNEDGTYDATVEGQTFTIEVPMPKQLLVHDVAAVPRRRNLEQYLPIFLEKLSLLKSTKEMLSKKDRSFLSLKR